MPPKPQPSRRVLCVPLRIATTQHLTPPQPRRWRLSPPATPSRRPRRRSRVFKYDIVADDLRDPLPLSLTSVPNGSARQTGDCRVFKCRPESGSVRAGRGVRRRVSAPSAAAVPPPARTPRSRARARPRGRRPARSGVRSAARRAGPARRSTAAAPRSRRRRAYRRERPPRAAGRRISRSSRGTSLPTPRRGDERGRDRAERAFR